MTTAYRDGFRAGQMDRLIGWCSRYAWTSFRTEPEYVQRYSAGYRAGWRSKEAA